MSATTPTQTFPKAPGSPPPRRSLRHQGPPPRCSLRRQVPLLAQTLPKAPGPPPCPEGARTTEHPASPMSRSRMAQRAHVCVTLAQEGPPSPKPWGLMTSSPVLPQNLIGTCRNLPLPCSTEFSAPPSLLSLWGSLWPSQTSPTRGSGRKLIE